MFGSIIMVVTLCLTSSCEVGSPLGTSKLCGGPALELHHLALSLGIALICLVGKFQCIIVLSAQRGNGVQKASY